MDFLVSREIVVNKAKEETRVTRDDKEKWVRVENLVDPEEMEHRERLV